MIRRLRDIATDHSGAVLLEFAVALPVLVLVMMGVLQFGLLFYYDIMVTNAAAVGARQFSISRLNNTPYSDAVSAVKNATSFASSQLTRLTVAVSVNGKSCTTDSSCSTALQNAYAATPAQSASVTVSYPCTILMPVSSLFSVNFAKVCPGGVLTSTMIQPVQ